MTTLCEVKFLPATNLARCVHWCIQIHLLPDRTARCQTKLQRKTLNPFYDERFEFRVGSPESLLSRLLHFSIYDFDRFSRHDLIGTAVMQPRLHTPDVTAERTYVLDIAGRLQVSERRLIAPRFQSWRDANAV